VSDEEERETIELTQKKTLCYKGELQFGCCALVFRFEIGKVLAARRKFRDHGAAVLCNLPFVLITASVPRLMGFETG
jgi:hypothetical protein